MKCRAVSAVVAALMAACSDEPPAADPCTCPEGVCPAEACGLELELPATCAPDVPEADVVIEGATIDSIEAGHRGAVCHARIAANEQAVVELTAPRLAATGAAQCPTGGQLVRSPFCTLRFELAESCRGNLSQAAVVVVNGVEYGVVAVDAPLVPCALIAEGQQATGTIRAGTEAVLTAPLTCHLGGSQPSLIMECAQ